MYLSDILATELLPARARTRTGPAPTLAPAPSDDALARIRARCLNAMALCGANSAGVSIFDKAINDELVWIATVGDMAAFEGHRYVRSESMCGVCFEYRATQLFIQPQRYFRWMAHSGIEMAEALVVPLFGPFGALYGTIWVIIHAGEGAHFDEQDARALEHLGKGMYASILAFDAAHALTQVDPRSK